MSINNRTYDILKWVSLIFLPAISALYFSLGRTWDWPNVEQIMGTIASIEIFIGALIGITTPSHNKTRIDGIMNVIETDDKKTFDLSLDKSPESLGEQNEVIFKVRK